MFGSILFLQKGVLYLSSCRVVTRQVCVNCWRLHRHLITRFYSEGGDDNGQFEGSIPKEKLSVSFSRSSGPGGQNVNKVNTKANVKLHVDSADWLSDRVKDRLKTLILIASSEIALSQFGSRINKGGELMISSQKYRTQFMNLNDACVKLKEMIKEASEVPVGPSQLTVARVKLLKRKAERKRLTDKKYQSIRKRERSRNDFD